MTITTRERFRGCLLGLAAGDALGTTVEFKPRGSFAPLSDMAGGGRFGLEPGQWTDDTSMALCLATSLLERNGYDVYDQMVRYVRWADEGYLSSTGKCFDIGGTVSVALHCFKDTLQPYCGSTDPQTAGNGCIMRLAPVPMFFYPDWKNAIHYAGDSSRTTHGAAECVDASRLFGSMIYKALDGQSKEEILLGKHFPLSESKPVAPRIKEIARGDYRGKERSAIVGSGYVVKSLEAALWCFDQTDSYREAVLTAVNLGDDADTTAAICGQIAGAYYGVEAIPAEWLKQLAMAEMISDLAERLLTSTPTT